MTMAWARGGAKPPGLVHLQVLGSLLRAFRVENHPRAGPNTLPSAAETAKGRPLYGASMGLGGTAKKLQRVVDVADELYAKVSDLREEIVAVRNSIDETKERLTAVETELEEQRELLERIAEAERVDTTLETSKEAETDAPEGPSGETPAGETDEPETDDSEGPEDDEIEA